MGGGQVGGKREDVRLFLQHLKPFAFSWLIFP